jgi:hypothetical protein
MITTEEATAIVQQPGTRPRLDAADIELLRAFEPVVRFTKGESFLPMSVSAYLASAARMRSDGSGRHHVVEMDGALSERTLSDGISDGVGARDFLTMAGTGRDEDIVARMFDRESRQAVGFHAGGGRLARVGYTSRVIDALFAISLLARGRVPGSLARRAVQRYRSLSAENTAHPYYGRVVRTATWTALQYWFFYAFNDWRSGFNGANDHEADWEQVLVYLDVDADGRAVPVWAAYAQHDYHGRDLRRRWDDSEQLDLIGDHPVVYAGAGSHASYFRPGEYLAEQPVRMPSFIQRVSTVISTLIRGRGGGDAGGSVMSIAFVDFARGDGVSIGPGADRAWDPVVMDETQRWVSGYSGLWGMSVEDPFEGEDAPAGPMFNRDRSVRTSWADPVSFAELDLEPPPSQAATLLRERARTVERRQAELAKAIPPLERELAAAGAEDSASTEDARTPSRVAERERLRTALTDLQREREENELRLGDLRQRQAAARKGVRPPPRAHLRRIPVPTPPGEDRTGMLLEAWAAVSVGLMLIVLVGVLLLSPRFGLAIAIGVIGLFVLIESILRGGVIGLLATWVRLLAVVAAAIVFVNFWQLGIIVAAIGAGIFLLRANVAELLDATRPNE